MAGRRIVAAAFRCGSLSRVSPEYYVRVSSARMRLFRTGCRRVQRLSGASLTQIRDYRFGAAQTDRTCPAKEPVAMSEGKVEFDGESFSVEASIVADGFGVTESQLRAMMHNGTITTRCERGIDEDAGRHRLTFFKGRRRLCLIVDASGRVIDRSCDTRTRRRLGAR